MRGLSDIELVGWLLGALDPDRDEEVASAVRASQRLRVRVAALGRRLDERPIEPPQWVLALPGVRMAGAPRVRTEDSLVMGPLAAGALFHVDLADAQDPEGTRLVILKRTETAWAVVFPDEPEEDLPVSRLPPGPLGRRIGLVAPPEAGVHRWALLYEARAPIDWRLGEDARWASLRDRLARGEPAVVVERRVKPRG